MSEFKTVIRGEGFSRDLKRLLKRYRSLEEDLEIFIQAQLKAYHKLGADNHGIFLLDKLGLESIKIYKAKKFACRSLKGKGARSGIRIIYSYALESDEIYLIEIYSKTDQALESLDRIKHYLAQTTGSTC